MLYHPRLIYQSIPGYFFYPFLFMRWWDLNVLRGKRIGSLSLCIRGVQTYGHFIQGFSNTCKFINIFVFCQNHISYLKIFWTNTWLVCTHLIAFSCWVQLWQWVFEFWIFLKKNCKFGLSPELNHNLWREELPWALAVGFWRCHFQPRGPEDRPKYL